MPRLKARLSVSSLDGLLKQLDEYKARLRAAPKRITENLVEFGENQIAQGIEGIRDKDGNYLAKAGSYMFGDSGLAYMEGEQAAFLEYGTGVTGLNSPHPQADEAGWQYNTGETINPATGDWSYWDPVKGKYVHTKGIPAQMPVLRAAQEMRNKLPELAREALEADGN